MSTHLTLSDLSTKAGREVDTIRRHIRRGWLKAEKFAGAKGWRVKLSNAQTWASKYLGKELAD
jgi:hypothetical protein